jgi:hypothetical protein
VHPKNATLTALCDGELEFEAAGRARAHLRECGTCRTEFSNIALERDRLLELDRGAGGPTAGEIEAVWSAVTAVIDSWKAGTTEGGALKAPVSQALRDSVRAELRTYLGRGGADSLDRSASGGRPEQLMTRTETLLEAFLGRDAAAAVIDDVIAGIRRRSFRAEAF